MMPESLDDTLEILQKEKEYVGMYLSAHPLDRYRFEIEKFAVPLTKLDEIVDECGRAGKSMKVNVAGQTKNFSAVADLEAWDNAGNVLDVNISPTQGQAQYELNLLRKDKAVPISAITVGQVADGYEVKGITIKPVQVTITGREEMVDSVSDLKTESIDISNATAPIDGTYNIVIPDGLTSKMTTVHVTVDIQRKA